MRTLFILGFLLLQQMAIGQKIDYYLPNNLSKIISQADYKKLVDLSVSKVKKKFRISEVKDVSIVLKDGQEMSTFNLDNLIVKCAGEADKTKWAQIIEDHFNSLFATVDAQKQIDPNNFEAVSKYLSLRIYPEATVKQRGGVENYVVKTDLEGTYTMLMLDLPGSFMPVQKPVFELWKKSTDSVFKLAQGNINQQPVQQVTHPLEVEGGNIDMYFLGNEDYAASYALDLQRNAPNLVGEWGAVVVMPNKGLVNICKISKDKPVDFVKFIQRLKPVVLQFYNNHPQPISTQFYWYYKGKFTRINVTEDNGVVNVISPMGLTELMTKKQ